MDLNVDGLDQATMQHFVGIAFGTRMGDANFRSQIESEGPRAENAVDRTFAAAIQMARKQKELFSPKAKKATPAKPAEKAETPSGTK